jgi:hypothetical protein
VAQATLELDAGSGDAPSGVLLTDDGLRRAFCGWIELASAIEDWRQAARADEPSGSSSDQQPKGRRT